MCPRINIARVLRTGTTGSLLVISMKQRMEWKREVTLALLVVMATAAWASTKEIAQELLDSRCSNIGGDNCGTGYLPGAGDDNDWLTGGGTPGKRCSNIGGDNCGTGYLPGAGDDNDWLTGGGTPGKRCSNIGGDNCGTGYLPGAAADNSWLSGGGGPGKKRSLSYAKLRAWIRCVNIGGDNCGNGYLPGAGDDHDWMNGGGGPGKRSLTVQQFCQQNPMSILCRNV